MLKASPKLLVDETTAPFSQKTKLAEAICYALSRWQGLSLFVGDGRVEIDFSTASLFETCKFNGIGPHAYLMNIIARIVNDHPYSCLDGLMPLADPSKPDLRHVA